MFLNQFVKQPELATAEPSRLGQLDRLKPIFRIIISLPHVDMPGFVPLAAEEEKPVSTESIHLWHPPIL